MTPRGQSSMGTYQAGVPSDAERNNADFGEVCTAQGGSFDNTGMCTVAAGQLWDPYSGVYQPASPDGVMPQAPTGRPSSPTTTSAPMPAREYQAGRDARTSYREGPET